MVEPVRCLYASWNAHDFEAMTKCYARDAVTERGGQRSPVDLEASRGYQEFHAITRARFRFDLISATDSVVDVVLHEENDFLSALGLREVTADWRYIVRNGAIIVEQHMRRDSAFAHRFREFVAWGRQQRPPLWSGVLDGSDNVAFNGETARALVELGRQWSGSASRR